MPRLSRIVLVRHGETDGESSIRFHGANDVALNAAGRAQARAARRQVPGDLWDLVVSSSLSRAWQTAHIVAPGRPVRLEPDFREIHFGRWEGLTRDEIAARDPILFEDWQSRAPGFEFPDGEVRAEFQARVLRGLERIRESAVSSVIVVAHKGVVRTIAEALSGESLLPDQPSLGGVVRLVRLDARSWRLTHGSAHRPAIRVG
jgi:broad specificity phosphatase PhoE